MNTDWHIRELLKDKKSWAPISIKTKLTPLLSVIVTSTRAPQGTCWQLSPPSYSCISNIIMERELENYLWYPLSERNPASYCLLCWKSLTVCVYTMCKPQLSTWVVWESLFWHSITTLWARSLNISSRGRILNNHPLANSIQYSFWSDYPYCSSSWRKIW